MAFVETMKMDLHKKAWQCSYQNRVSDQKRTECQMEVWLNRKLKDKKDCALHYCG